MAASIEFSCPPTDSSMKNKTWSYLKAGEIYLYNFNLTKDNGYSFYLTDLSRIYYENLNLMEIEARSKELNPNLEIETKRLLELVESCTNCELMTSTKINSVDPSNGLSCEIKISSMGFPFVWRFETHPVQEELHSMKDNLISPLIGMTAFLFAQNKSLIEIIKKKDEEIKDLKGQGAKLSRKYLETSKFDEKLLLTEANLPKLSLDSAMKDVFGSGSKNYIYEYVTKELNQRKVEIEEQKTTKNETETKPSKSLSSDDEEDETDQHSLELKRREELQKRLSKQDKTGKKKKIKF